MGDVAFIPALVARRVREGTTRWPGADPVKGPTVSVMASSQRGYFFPFLLTHILQRPPSFQDIALGIPDTLVRLWNSAAVVLPFPLREAVTLVTLTDTDRK